MPTFYTTAPQAYDGFSTRTVKEVAGTDKYSGKVYRQVEMDERDVTWQTCRYGSGMHPAYDEAGFKEMTDAGIIIPADQEQSA